MLESTLQTLLTLERTISSERGNLVFFGLIKRPDLVERWDLVVSASWFNADDHSGDFNYIWGKTRELLADLSFLNTVVLLRPTEPFIQLITRVARIEHSIANFQEVSMNGLRLEHAIIFTSANPG